MGLGLRRLARGRRRFGRGGALGRGGRRFDSVPALALVAVVAALAVVPVLASVPALGLGAGLGLVPALAAFTFFPAVPGSPVLAVPPDFPGVDDDTADLLADFPLPERLPRPSGAAPCTSPREPFAAFFGRGRGCSPTAESRRPSPPRQPPWLPALSPAIRTPGQPRPGTDNHPCHGISAPDRPPAVGSRHARASNWFVIDRTVLPSGMMGTTVPGQADKERTRGRRSARAPLFAALDDEQAAELRASMSEVTSRAETRCSMRATRVTASYVVTEGKVKLHRTSPDGRENMLAVLGPGELIESCRSSTRARVRRPPPH